jgi:hypothetical protein
MSYLKKDEQVYVKSVEQLKAVYEVLKEHWHEYYCLPEEIKYLNNHVGYCFVNWSKKEWGKKGIALFKQDNNATTITFDEFMARINTTTRIPKDFDATKAFASCNPQQEITDKMLSVFKVGLNMLKIDMPKSMMEKIMLFSKEVTEKGGDVTLMDVAKIETRVNDKYKDDE